MRELPPLPADSIIKTHAFPTVAEATRRRRRRWAKIENIGLAGIFIFVMMLCTSYGTAPGLLIFGGVALALALVGGVMRTIAS